MANIIVEASGTKSKPWPVSPINESEVKVEASPNKFQAYSHAVCTSLQLNSFFAFSHCFLSSISINVLSAVCVRINGSRGKVSFAQIFFFFSLFSMMTHVFSFVSPMKIPHRILVSNLL